MEFKRETVSSSNNNNSSRENKQLLKSYTNERSIRTDWTANWQSSRWTMGMYLFVVYKPHRWAQHYAFTAEMSRAGGGWGLDCFGAFKNISDQKEIWKERKNERHSKPRRAKWEKTEQQQIDENEGEPWAEKHSHTRHGMLCILRETQQNRNSKKKTTKLNRNIDCNENNVRFETDAFWKSSSKLNKNKAARKF